MIRLTEEFVQQLRTLIGIALVRSGYIDQDPKTGTIEIVDGRPCLECPSPTDMKCGCPGIPILHDDVWNIAKLGINKVMQTFIDDQVVESTDRGTKVRDDPWDRTQVSSVPDGYNDYYN